MLIDQLDGSLKFAEEGKLPLLWYLQPWDQLSKIRFFSEGKDISFREKLYPKSWHQIGDFNSWVLWNLDPRTGRGAMKLQPQARLARLLLSSFLSKAQLIWVLKSDWHKLGIRLLLALLQDAVRGYTGFSSKVWAGMNLSWWGAPKCPQTSFASLFDGVSCSRILLVNDFSRS